jgi:hypothetical protein
MTELKERVQREGFAFVRAMEMRRILAHETSPGLRDQDQFFLSWRDLVLDTYMADGGRYRLRRHAVLSSDPGVDPPRLEPRQPHYQNLEYNRLNGGVERWFEPIDAKIVEGETFRAILRFGSNFFRTLSPGAAWKVEVHQFRIEANKDQPGRPTPEGPHRDGVQFVLVLLIRRENVASGTTCVYDLDGRELGSFTLSDPYDAAIVDDSRVLHGVTPIVPIDPTRPAYRDVLVVTFLKK